MSLRRGAISRAKSSLGFYCFIARPEPQIFSKDCSISQESLAVAVKKNKHIPAYLLGRKKIPQSFPEYYSPRDESEAMFYIKENLEAWKTTPGALDWVLDQTK